MAIDLSYSTDQAAIHELFSSFLAKESPVALARASEPLGFDRGLWTRLGALGAPGLCAPPSSGGSGVGLSEATVVAEAIGRAIAPVPLIEHLSATLADHDPRLVNGSGIATLALRPADPTGRWRLVPAGAVADVVVGVDGDDLVSVRSAPPGHAPANHACSPLADRSSRRGQRTVLGPAADLRAPLNAWKVMTAAALVGIADAALGLARDYVLARHQFGVPIGSFQSVQHGLADLPGLIDGARLLVHKAAWAARWETGIVDVDDGEITDPTVLASMAFLFASDAARRSTDRALHYHGGYGFSEEYDIQLFYRRARGWSLVLGDPGEERRGLGRRLFDGVEGG